MKYLWNRYTKFILTIIIFFCSAFFQLIPVKLFNINNITPKIQILLTLFSNMMNILLLVLMYYKDLKEDFKVFFDKCDSFVSRVSDDLLESEKVKINEFKDVYSSIDSKIYKIKVHNWLDSNKNKLADFNHGMGEEISAFILDDNVEELKRKTECLYNKIVE